MKQSIRRTLRIVGAFAALSSATAYTQTPIKNVDEPGRSPYQESILHAQDASTCNPGKCIVKFTPVPAGYRLVITYASAFFRLESNGKGATLAIHPYGVNGHSMWLAAPKLLGSGVYLYSAPLSFYFEPGETPSLDLYGYPIVVSSEPLEVALVGYLVEISPPVVTR